MHKKSSQEDTDLKEQYFSIFEILLKSVPNASTISYLMNGEQ